MRSRQWGWLATALLVAQCDLGLAGGLTGTVRERFIAGVLGTCLGAQTKNLAALPAAAVGEFCRCYANGLADRLTIEELKAQDAMSQDQQKAAMRPLVEAVGRPCLAAAQRSR